jgi:excisionase family DNA binding protein
MVINTNKIGNLISAKQTSERLGISRAKLSRIKNQIGFYRIGRNIKFREENVADYLKKVECAPALDNHRQSENGGDE